MRHIFQNSFLTFLRIAAQLQLRKSSPIVVGITGSAGKTSTVAATAQVLSVKYRVAFTKKGNSETGLPLEILNIPVKNYRLTGWLGVVVKTIWHLLTDWKKIDIFVAEMGIDSDQYPKNMEYLLRIIQPKYAALLNVSNVHGANFTGKETLSAIAQEKVKLLNQLPQDGLAVYSADHPVIDTYLSPQSQTKSFSLSHPADAQLLRYSSDLGGTSFVFLIDGSQFTLTFSNQLHLKESFGSFATALLIGKALEIPHQTAISQLENSFRLPPSRMSLIEGINHSTIIDSSYNSSLEPTVGALLMLKQISTQGKRIAVLGDMREIGKEEKQDHQKLARVAAQTADEIFLVGPLMRKYALPELARVGFAKNRTHWFETSCEARDPLRKAIEKNDLILVKGSQNTIFLEIVVEAIMENPQQASSVLCRQSADWIKLKRKFCYTD